MIEQPIRFENFREGDGIPRYAMEDTQNLIKACNEISKGILYPHLMENNQRRHQWFEEVPTINPVNLEYARFGYGFFNPYRTHNHHHYYHHDRESTKEEREYDQRVAAVTIGAILAGIGSYFAGAATAQYNRIRREIEAFESLKKDWNLNRGDYARNFQSKVDEIIKISGEILDRKKLNHLLKLAFYVTIVAAGILGVVGGVSGASDLIKAGLLLGLSSTIAGLAKLGYDSYNDLDKEDATTVKKAIRNLERLFPGLV